MRNIVRNIRIVPVMAMCVLCAVWVIVGCEPYACVAGTLISGPTNTDTGVACSTVYTCDNGTAAPGGTAGRDAELCAVCDDGYHMEGNSCEVNVYLCANGAIMSGVPDVHNTEQCSSCAYGFIFNDFQQCRAPLTWVQSVSDDANLLLDDSRSLATVTVGGNTFLVTGGFEDDGISVLSVGADGALSPRENVPDDDDLELDGVFSITTAVVGGVTYLFAAGLRDDGISVFSMGADGKLKWVDSVTDDSNLLLNEVTSVATAVVEGVTYLFATGGRDDGGSVFSVGADGKLTWKYNLRHSPSNSGPTAILSNSAHSFSSFLDGASSLATAKMGDTTYLYVGAKFGFAINIFSLDADGVTGLQILSKTHNSSPLDNVVDLTVAVVGDTTYLFAAALYDGVSVYSVGEDGGLTLVDSVVDEFDGFRELGGPSSVTTAVLGETTYLFVAAFRDHALSMFSVGSDGQLTLVQSVIDDDNLQLHNASSVAIATIGGVTHLYVAGAGDDGVTVFGVGK